MRMEISLSQRMTIEMCLQPSISPGSFRTNPFYTDGELDQCSFKDVLTVLAKTQEKDFVDPVRFRHTVNREIWRHRTSAATGRFRKNLGHIIEMYQPDHALAIALCTLLQTKGTNDMLSGKVARQWASLLRPGKTARAKNSLVELATLVKEKDADVSDAFDLLSATLGQPRGRKLVIDRVNAYLQGDVRQLAFTAKMYRTLKRKTRAPFAGVSDGIDELYMIDKDLGEPLALDTIVSHLSKRMSPINLTNPTSESHVPLPIRAFADRLGILDDLAVVARDEEFQTGREIQRRIYHGLAALSERHEGMAIARHLGTHVKKPRDFAKILGTLDVLRRHPDVTYDFTKTSPPDIERALQLTLVDHSVKRIGLDTGTLRSFVDKSQEPSHRISCQVLTTLAGYYVGDPRLMKTLRDVTSAVVTSDSDWKAYRAWKYETGVGPSQMACLDGNTTAWRENTSVVRIVGAMHGLRSHMGAVKTNLAKIIQQFEEQYSCKHSPSSIDDAIREKEQFVTELQQSTNGKKETGMRIARTQERIDYARLIKTITDLSEDNYAHTLDVAEELSKKARAPYVDLARWVASTLDQPDYRSARKLHVYEVDDPENMLRMGERPVPHCQNWKSNASWNRTLLSFATSSHLKLIHLGYSIGDPLSMTTLRLIPRQAERDETVGIGILAENVYATEWSHDHGVALFGSLAQKALEMAEESGEPVDVISNNEKIVAAMTRFAKKYEVEVHSTDISFKLPPSRSPIEYVDCIGEHGQKFDAESEVRLGKVEYVRFVS